MFEECARAPQPKLTITVNKPSSFKVEDDLKIIELDEDLYNSNGFSQASLVKVT